MILGLTLVALGAVFLLKDLGLVYFTSSFWSLFWPALLMVLGIYIVLAEAKIRRFKNSLGWRICRTIFSKSKK